MTTLDPALAHALNVRLVDHRQLGAEPADHAVIQTSTIAALLDTKYDGDVTIGEVLAGGDLGLGTLNGLDGELIIVDGEAWQAPAEGPVRRVSADEKTPFAVATRFITDEIVEIDSPLNHGELLDLLEQHAPQQSGCDAIRIDGLFPAVHVRSVYRQEEPYPPFADAAAHQVEWHYEALRGTVVGFRFPHAASSVEMAGHHLHFISDDRTKAGHLLECSVGPATLRIEAVGEMRLELPPGVELPHPSEIPSDSQLREVEGGG
ncbi:MAG: acetolactate decarboxylase [Actinobacteria bacterium]|uniref:Alpha-acetolactate decarboxylase n=1 Tax=freshwater metagenome TaxID=449393 RepID=A0A6J5Z2Q7_9ZZZZ|nr:acetolactate decarboxylase [Actinomycetota bacterium]